MGSWGFLFSPPPCQGLPSASSESSLPEVCEVATVWIWPRLREVGPLSSRLPRRHLTGHGEVRVDLRSSQLFLASVCVELGRNDRVTAWFLLFVRLSFGGWWWWWWWRGEKVLVV